MATATAVGNTNYQGANGARSTGNITAALGDKLYVWGLSTFGPIDGISVTWNGLGFTLITSDTQSGISLNVWELDVTTGGIDTVDLSAPSSNTTYFQVIKVTSGGTRGTIQTDEGSPISNPTSVTVPVGAATDIVLVGVVKDDDSTGSITNDPDASGYTSLASSSFNQGTPGVNGLFYSVGWESGTTSVSPDFTLNGAGGRAWAIAAFPITDLTGVPSTEGVVLTRYNDIT